MSAKLGANIIVGNDEFMHRRYPCDLRRTLQLATAISSVSPGTPLVYVRFNPHFFKINGVLHDLPLPRSHKKLWGILQRLTSETLTSAGLNLVYVNYDQVAAREGMPWERLRHFAELPPDDINFENSVLLRDCIIQVH